jgi:hypothetical protein
MTEIKARELELHLFKLNHRGHIIHIYKSPVWIFTGGLIMIEDSEKPGYPSYFLSSLDEVKKVNHKVRDFKETGRVREYSPRQLALIIQVSTKTYGYNQAHYQAWLLVRLALRVKSKE